MTTEMIQRRTRESWLAYIGPVAKAALDLENALDELADYELDDEVAELLSPFATDVERLALVASR